MRFTWSLYLKKSGSNVPSSFIEWEERRLEYLAAQK